MIFCPEHWQGRKVTSADKKKKNFYKKSRLARPVHPLPEAQEHHSFMSKLKKNHKNLAKLSRVSGL